MIYIAYWCKADQIITIPDALDGLEELVNPEIAKCLGFSLPLDTSRLPDQQHQPLIEIFTTHAQRVDLPGRDLQARYVLFWNTTRAVIHLFFTATVFDVFAIVRQITQYQQDLQQVETLR